MTVPYDKNNNPPTKNEAFTFRVMLFDSDGAPVDGPTIAAGDFKVQTDGGGFANCDNLPTASGYWVTIVLSADEMNGDIVDVQWIDAAGGEWLGGGAEIMTTTSYTIQDMSGSGSITFTYTLTSSVDGSAIESAEVFVTTDAAGQTLIAQGETDSDGEVVFFLDAGTYYLWRYKADWTFTNPDTEVVS